MRTNWKKELCSSRPELIERVNVDTYIQRKNIQEVTSDEGTSYVCDSRFISEDYFEAIEVSLQTYQTLLEQADATDQANADILLAQAEIQATQEEQDEVLADILINTTQMEV